MSITLIGHRGALAIEPENTVRGFVRAEQEQMDEIELDLRTTADGALVVLHDATVDRTTNGSGAIAEMTFDEARELDAGWGEQIPTFDEVVDCTSLRMQVELKVMSAVGPFACAIHDRHVADRLYATSHDPDIVRALDDAAPEIDRALILPHSPPDSVARGLAVRATSLCLGLAALGSELMDECRAAGLRIMTWPCDEPGHLEKAVHLGVDGIASDNPALARSWRDQFDMTSA